MGRHSKPTDKSTNKAKAISGSQVEDNTRQTPAGIASKTRKPPADAQAFGDLCLSQTQLHRHTVSTPTHKYCMHCVHFSTCERAHHQQVRPTNCLKCVSQSTQSITEQMKKQLDASVGGMMSLRTIQHLLPRSRQKCTKGGVILMVALWIVRILAEWGSVSSYSCLFTSQV